MTSKGYFKNQFADSSENEKVDALIIASKNGVYYLSDIFLEKLEKFQHTKLQHLKTEMRNDIFHDGTVYTGSCGLAMYYFLIYTASDKENIEYLRTALDYLNVKNLKGRRISFLCGDAGPLALGAVIAYKLARKRPDDLPDYKILIQRLLSLISLLEESPDEILYGKAGYLYALLFVMKHIPEKEIIPASHVEKVIQAILQSGKQFSLQMKCNSPLLWQWHEKIYLGAAHGMAGIIYMLLQARQFIVPSDLRDFIKPAIDWLLNHSYASGNFPSSLGSASGDRLVQWCHGAPGFLPLCIAAYEEFEEEKYLKVALKCGEVVWERGLSGKGYSMCHGVSGNAYTFLQLYQVTKKPIHLYRACCFMEWCAVERTGTELHRPDRPASLFEGLVGRLYLLEDLKQPLRAKFPGFTI